MIASLQSTLSRHRGAILRAALALSWFSVAIFAFRQLPVSGISALLRASPGFWCAAVGYVLVHPLADLVIFRRLWGRRKGMLGVLTRRFISNEVMFSYSGDVYLFAWARGQRIDAPLHAIKDVSVLSALVGNFVTIGLIAAFALGPGLASLGLGAAHISLSVALVVVPSLAMVGFRRRLLRMSGRDALFVGSVHVVRAVAMLALLVPLWLAAEPTLGWGTCLLFLTVRQLLSRVPLMPGKDMLFAGSVALIGKAGAAATVAATSGALGITATETLLALFLAAATLLPAGLKIRCAVPGGWRVPRLRASAGGFDPARSRRDTAHPTRAAR